VLTLEVFAVWSLSFLPGWLYIRFLGQRAGALWDEYVLHNEPSLAPVWNWQKRGVHSTVQT
jgi:hypothetical protein